MKFQEFKYSINFKYLFSPWLHTSITLIFTLFLCFPALAQISSLSKVITALKVIRTVESELRWGLGVVEAIDLDKELPVRNDSKILEESFQKMLLPLSEIKASRLSNSIPIFPNIQANNRDNRRMQLHSYTISLLAVSAELRVMKDTIRGISDVEEHLSFVSNGLNKLAGTLERSIGKPEFALIVNVLGGNLFDIHTKYLKRIGNEQIRIRLAKKESIRTYSLETAALDVAMKKLLIALEDERNDVKVDMLQLRNEFDDIELKTAELEKEQLKLDDKYTPVAKYEQRIDRIKYDIETYESLLNQPSQNNTNLINRIARLNSKYSEPYTWCPNHEPYDDCNHTVIKRNWDSRQRKLSDQLNRLQSDLTNTARDQENRREYNKRKILTLKNTLNDLEARLPSIRTGYIRAKEAYEETKTDLQDKRKIFLEKMWVSKSTVIYSSSESDSEAINNSKTRLLEMLDND